MIRKIKNHRILFETLFVGKIVFAILQVRMVDDNTIFWLR